MIEQPIKLTDEVLSTISDSCHEHVGVVKVKDLVAAIRALRDRARAVVDTAWASKCVVCADGDGMRANRAFVTALREVLP